MVDKEKVLEAYKEKNIQPIQSQFVDVVEVDKEDISCGCALTALYLKEKDLEFNDILGILDVGGVIVDYFRDLPGFEPTSFYLGFDLHDFNSSMNERSFNNGREVRQYLSDNGMHIYTAQGGKLK
jgi:hypothetical protein